MEEEINKILFGIKNDIPEFNKEEFLEYTKWSIIDLYNKLKDEQQSNLNYPKDLISNLIQEKNKFRITKDIDHISIQYTELFDYIKKDNKKYIKIYCSIYFYDNAENNSSLQYTNDKFWNDIWIVTFSDTNNTNNSNCSNCGADFKYNKFKQIYECEYCGNTTYNTISGNWELIDIELYN